MALSIKQQLINYLAKRNFKSQNAFTLVELIVVVVIIGILSSIAIPSFQSASEKAKQKEASTLVGSYAKAAQAYYTEYSILARTPENLSEYVSVVRCKYGDPKTCKDRADALVPETSARVNHTWRSPSGNYNIQLLTRSNVMINIRALPHNPASGLGVVGCFNTATGATRVLENAKAGNPPSISC